MPPASVPVKRALHSKEAALFKELLNLYESRQLKKAQKTADQILKKFPEHGGTCSDYVILETALICCDYALETLCMKGLVLTHMGRREEGLDLVKKGVRLDLTSHIVWHVFGLIQKGEKNYEEALKSYTQALRFDKVSFTPVTHLRTAWYDSISEDALGRVRSMPAEDSFVQHCLHESPKAIGTNALTLTPSRKTLTSYGTRPISKPSYDNTTVLLRLVIPFSGYVPTFVPTGSV